MVLKPRECPTAAGPGWQSQGFLNANGIAPPRHSGQCCTPSAPTIPGALWTDHPLARGINSFQLYSDGMRWWIVTIFWDAETADKPIAYEVLSAVGELVGTETRDGLVDTAR